MEVAALYLAASFLVGAIGSTLVHREELKYLRGELRVAHAQIAHAVIHDSAVIPPRIEEVPPLEPLPKELLACVEQWEDAESRAIEEAKIRQWRAEGWGVPAILRQYGATHDGKT